VFVASVVWTCVRMTMAKMKYSVMTSVHYSICLLLTDVRLQALVYSNEHALTSLASLQARLVLNISFSSQAQNQ